MAEFINYYQVIVMNERHIAIGCPLHKSRQDQACLRGNDMTRGLQYLPRRYSLVICEEDPDTLETSEEDREQLSRAPYLRGRWY